MKSFIAIFLIVFAAQQLNADPEPSLGSTVNDLLGTVGDTVNGLLGTPSYNLPYCPYYLPYQVVQQLLPYGCLPVGVYFNYPCLAVTYYGGIIYPCGYNNGPQVVGGGGGGGLLGTGINL